MIISILLGYCRGERFIKEQLRSINCPSGYHCKVFIGIDGPDAPALSTAEFPHLEITLLSGPQCSPAANFFRLTRLAPDSAFYAFCDQDDVWLPDKLERASRVLMSISDDIPGLYCSTTTLIDAAGNIIGPSRQPTYSPCFANALVECIAGGNTMVFNSAARDCFLAAGTDLPPLSHDWRLYLTTTACGGCVIFDPQPTVLYRQHSGNLLGKNRGVMARLKRSLALIDGRYQTWMESQLRAVLSLQDSIPEDLWKMVRLLTQARGARLPQERLRLLIASGTFRQSRLDQYGLYLAALLKRL